eukprot:Tamp_13311.p1 GENE.Tamp_13311~~Tamp_13311.p1  ORF type:complete len:274 (+),score=45.29 Tamp_13311:657-1478(+)
MGEEADFLVMDRLGPSLDDLWWSETGGAGGMEEGHVMTLATQMLHLLRQLHERGYVHRDLKPENFLLAHGKREGEASSTGNLHLITGNLHLIDFGIARRAPDCSEEGCDASMSVPSAAAGDVTEEEEEDKAFAGTCRYASARAHQCVPLGRGDDVEALVYCLAFLLRGSLPWDAQGVIDWGLYIEMVGTQKSRLLARLPVSEAEIEEGIREGVFNLVRDLPFHSARFLLLLLAHAKSVPFNGMPDYAYCQTLVREAQEDASCRNDCTGNEAYV